MANNVVYRLDEWNKANKRVISTASREREVSQSTRNASTSLRRSTSNHLQRTQRDVQNKLSLRIDAVNLFKIDLERTSAETATEISALMTHKELVERKLQEKDAPLEITMACVELRDSRQGIDKVNDGVEQQLHKEAELIKRCQAVLKGKIDDCTEQLRLLRAANFQLERDLTDKFEASGIDSHCASLSPTSKLDYHRDSVKIESKSVLLDDWQSFTEENITRAEKEIGKSVMLREDIDRTLKETDVALNQCANAVESAFNSRIAEYNDTKNVAEQQLLKIKREISAQEEALDALNESIRAQESPMKVSQTRLMERTQRPNVELVRDAVQFSLVNEVEQIDGVVTSLSAAMAQGQAVLKALTRSQLQLEDDIATKTASLNIDKRCMQQRQQFKYRVTA